MLLSLSGTRLVTSPAALSPAEKVRLSVDEPYVQVTPKAIKANRNLENKNRTVSMFGSLPVKPSYVKCHGGCLTLCAVPPEQLSSLKVILVRDPIRSPWTLGMVLEWKEPSMVTWHLMLTKDPASSSLDQVTLKFVALVISRFLADAVLSALASSMAAMSAVKPSLIEMRIDAFRVSAGTRWSRAQVVMPSVCGVADAVRSARHRGHCPRQASLGETPLSPTRIASEPAVA